MSEYKAVDPDAKEAYCDKVLMMGCKEYLACLFIT